MTIFTVVAAILFVLSSGLLFNEQFRSNVFLVCVSGIIALVASYFLFEQIVESVVKKQMGGASGEPSTSAPNTGQQGKVNRPVILTGRDADKLSGFGLTGTWAADCQRSPSATNIHYSFSAIGNGDVALHRNFGNQTTNDKILQVFGPTGSSVTFWVNLTDIDDVRTWDLQKGSDGRVRLVREWQHFLDLKEWVRDGKYTSNGNPTPWLVHCN